MTLACGTSLYYLTRCRLSGGLTTRQAFVLTPLAYTTLCVFAALPLYVSDYSQLRDNFTNAFFGTMSGLTTTGASVILGLDNAPAGLLLWRALRCRHRRDHLTRHIRKVCLRRRPSASHLQCSLDRDDDRIRND